MGDLFGASPDRPYEERLERLAGHRIALWESLQSCIRPGSADSDITEEIPNDFNAFFQTRRNVTHLFFDGGKAFQSFRKLVLPNLQKKDLILVQLTSTSPRHAGMPYAGKLGQWRMIAETLEKDIRIDISNGRKD